MHLFLTHWTVVANSLKQIHVSVASDAEPCHFDKVSGPASTSYVPSYGTDSGSLHNFKIILKIKFLSPIFLLKLDGNRLILTWCSFICSPTLIPFKTNVSNPYLRPILPGAGT
jgi:hypothetical protein